MRKAIIVWGGWKGHEPEQCARIVAGLLAEDGFHAEVTNDLGIFGSPQLAQADLVVPVITGESLEKAHADALVEAVRGGLGLGGHHGSLATSFKESAPFRYVSGVTWVAHPGNIIDFRVAVTFPEDPVMQGIPDFDYRSEQYYLHYDPSIEILATTTFTGEHDPAARDVTMPVVFKRRFGAGRVFYSALGHVAAEFDHPHMPLILRRGLSWAARR
ncbi:ThuA domain-containing protein [Rhizobium sp. 16-449-1b]|uniref:ThuA domain-containing protein n=1 Tax=Rhizobium sp. 16-449-1b TaxID=2819989 RepID=UPI001ADB3B9F|nr:ThuA domain-containing protein [Rhizobium sp. 16-449-1b]MBO9196939.1 ThuA domain-containing protein [Rhizobium sp. 16-449-1b]